MVGSEMTKIDFNWLVDSSCNGLTFSRAYKLTTLDPT